MLRACTEKVKKKKNIKTLKSFFQSHCYNPTLELIRSQLVHFAKNNFNHAVVLTFLLQSANLRLTKLMTMV